MSEHKTPNRLARESSPYLRQHADNPVDWYPWGEEALNRAKAGDRPILLSIGYSSCHWCHVMAHESFADPGVAALMNEGFVNIKVDREERPDLDRVYQLAHQILTQQSGGWPLTIFLDPHSLLPFFSGTYFPKQPRYQLPGFVDLLMRIAEVWKTKRDELKTQGDKLKEIFSQIASIADPNAKVPAGKNLTQLLQKARDSLTNSYDARNGGFGTAPKFPMPFTLERLMRHWAFVTHSGGRERDALDMAMTTLTRIARGGIYDHLGGGFCRYSTDAQWVIPHFEKMLYDNGPLLSLYCDALSIGPDLLFEGAIRDTANWVMREMQHPLGGYFSSLDADSEGEEGKFYVWRRAEIKQLLSEDEYLLVETLYGLDRPANFEGKWNLYRNDAWTSVVQRLGLQRPAADELLSAAKAKLLAAREQRIRPSRDDKVLVSWNALMIKGMVKAYAQLNERRYLDSALASLDFIREHMRAADGRLLATWMDGEARHPAYLDDYAFLLEALITLMQVHWRPQDLAWAVELANLTLAHFEDKELGGFFFTAHDHETLIHRAKPLADESMASGNAVLIRSLITLGNLMSKTEYVEAAERAIKFAAMQMQQHPAGHCTLLSALEELHYEPQMVLLTGPSADLESWWKECSQGYKPWRKVFIFPNDDDQAHRPGLKPPYLPRIQGAGDRARPIAYVCTGMQCSLPIKSIEGLKEALK